MEDKLEKINDLITLNFSFKHALTVLLITRAIVDDVWKAAKFLP